ncbi:MAG: hypothetical protein AAFR63_16645, partial [Cyanobacteria bacterium J06631_6]
MTNPSPPESPNPIPERRRRPATGVTFDEMIAIIVAFSTIGTILFWSIGGRNSNLGLGGGTNVLSSDRTTDTGLGFGGILADDTVADSGLGDKDLERENRQLLAQLEEQDQAVAYVPPSRTAELSARAEKKSLSLDSGAKLVPLAGVAALPTLAGRSGNQDVADKAPDKIKTEKNEVEATPEVVPPVVTTPETAA